MYSDTIKCKDNAYMLACTYPTTQTLDTCVCVNAFEQNAEVSHDNRYLRRSRMIIATCGGHA